MIPANSYIDKMIKFAVMAGGSYFVWYFAGPMTGEIGRHGYEYYYQLLYGIPKPWELGFWVNYVPMRGHVTHYAYQYGDVACAAISAPFFYKLSDMIRKCFGISNSTDNQDELDDSDMEVDELNERLSHVIDDLGEQSKNDQLTDSPLSERSAFTREFVSRVQHYGLPSGDVLTGEPIVQSSSVLPKPAAH